MVAVPVDTPLTTPKLFTDAIPVALLDHVPPVPVVVRLVEEPTHTSVAPLIVLLAGAAFTVTL
jgi:hypothetical protein